MRFNSFCLFIAALVAVYLRALPGVATASTPVDVAGTITSVLSPTLFVYQTGAPYGYVQVVYTASIVVPSGSRISVGQTVTVTGAFVYHKLIASKVTLTSTYHIATLAYDSYSGQGTGASAASVNQLVSYAQGNSKSLADCHSVLRGCKAVFYVNPNHVWNNKPSSCVSHPDAEEMAAASEGWFVHTTGYTSAAHRVHGVDRHGCSIWELNPNSAGVQTWWRNYLRANADQYDIYFLDADSMKMRNESYFPYGSGPGCEPWFSVCDSTEEIPGDVAQVIAHANFVNAMSHRNGSAMSFLFQQASFVIPVDVSAFAATNRFVGMSCEGCIATWAEPVRPELYVSVLKEMAAINTTSGAYLLISHGSSPDGSATQILQRLVTTGIVWLAYSEGHTIVQPDLASNTKILQIWPEDLIYPSAPLESMVDDPSDLQVVPGVYRREFASCYQRGVAVGPCAAIVNANSWSVSIQSAWFSQRYRHIVTLSGGEVLAGGIANVAGAAFVPNLTPVQGTGALLLTR